MEMCFGEIETYKENFSTRATSQDVGPFKIGDPVDSLFGIAKVSLSGEILYTNRKLREMISGVPDRFDEQSLIFLSSFVKNNLIKTDELLIGEINRGNTVQIEEVEYTNLDGKRGWFNIYISPFWNPRSNSGCLLIYFANSSGSAELKELLYQAQKMEAIGLLANGVAHDFNNILTVINGNTELLRIKLDEESQLQKHIDEIYKATESAANLTTQLLQFSRKNDHQTTVLNINEVIEEKMIFFDRLINEDIKFVTDLTPNPYKIKINKGQLEQVIVNLVVNAQDAMPSGGEISIKTEHVLIGESYQQTHEIVKPGKYLQITISDDGPGMTEEVRKKVFDPFFTTKEADKGTGLGLFIVYGIIQRYYGFITVFSEIGKGTKFNIFLPATSGVVQRNTAGMTNAVQRGTETVLIVEDEMAVRRVATEMLTGLGYEIYSAFNGDEALRLTWEKNLNIDLLLTDLGMPEMGGLDLSERLLVLQPNVKVLLMSGHPDRIPDSHGNTKSDFRYIQKPFHLSDLAQAVREVLDD